MGSATAPRCTRRKVRQRQQRRRQSESEAIQAARVKSGRQRTLPTSSAGDIRSAPTFPAARNARYPFRNLAGIGNRGLVAPSACLRITGSFYPPCIRPAGRSACSEPSRRVRVVQLDQHKRLASDFASASDAEGRWFVPAPPRCGRQSVRQSAPSPQESHQAPSIADETTDVGYESGTTVSPDYTAHT